MLQRTVSRRAVIDGMLGAAAGTLLLPRLAGAARLGPPEQPSGGPPDLILTNANVITMDPAKPVARAVAIKDGRIMAVATGDEVATWAISPTTQVRDLGGHTLLPGFFDSHNHMLGTGLNLSAVDLSSTRSIADVLAAIGERAKATPSGQWVISSSRWHESQLAEGRFPRREELDAAAPDHPVLIRRGGHNIVLNSAAFNLAGITRETPDPPGGTYVKDPATSELSGHVIGAPAFGPVMRRVPQPTNDDRVNALRAILRLYREAGITSVIEPGLPAEEMDAFRTVAAEGGLTTRTSMMWRFEPGTTAQTLQTALDTLSSGQVQIEPNDPWLRTVGIKLVADGGVETGFHREPYAYTDDPTSPRGKPRMSAENMVAFCTEAARRGWQVGTHCVGDAAIDMVLDVYRQVDEAVSIAEKRWTLIHMMAAKPDHFALVNQLRLAITAQQPLMFSLAAGFLKYLGPERTREIEPLRRYLDGSTLPVGGGSDSPVTPYQPLIGIWSSVTRSTDLIGVQGPEWRVSVDEALRMYTLGSAWCAFQEREVGSLEAGKRADLVALSADPRTVEPDAIKDIQVVATIVDGRVVFDRQQGHVDEPLDVVRATLPRDDACACGDTGA